MKLQHTEGDWKLYSDNFACPEIRIGNIDGRVICHFDRIEDGYNAQLLVAAPKMLHYLIKKAAETGEQHLYDLVAEIIGVEVIHYTEMIDLAEQVRQLENQS